MNYALYSAGVGIVALVFAFFLVIRKIDTVTVKHDRMNEIASYIQEGSMAFLRREYKVLVIFAGALAVIIAVGLHSYQTAIAFLCGAFFSALAGFFGMKVATKANVRTAFAAKESGMNKALSGCFFRRCSNGHVRCGAWSIRYQCFILCL